MFSKRSITRKRRGGAGFSQNQRATIKSQNEAYMKGVGVGVGVGAKNNGISQNKRMTLKSANEAFMKNKGAFAMSVFKGLGNNVHLKRVEEWENIAEDYKSALEQLLDLNKRYFKEPVPENLSPNDLQSWMASRLGRNTGLRRENYDNEKEELELVIGMKAAKLQKALEKIKPDDQVKDMRKIKVYCRANLIRLGGEIHFNDLGRIVRSCYITEQRARFILGLLKTTVMVEDITL
jgi:hypothetical protein